MAAAPKRKSKDKFLLGVVVLVVLVLSSVALFSLEFEVDPFLVPCRMADGKVWLFQVSDGDSWKTTEFLLGPNYSMKKEVLERKSLRCDPGNIDPHQISMLRNGHIESLSLEIAEDGTTTLEVYEDMVGTYTYVYTYSDGLIRSVSSRTGIGQYRGMFAVMVLTLVFSLTIILFRPVLRRELLGKKEESEEVGGKPRGRRG